MQETWAIHGVYPAMAWTPDSKSSSSGRAASCSRIDVATQAGDADIPFHVEDTRTRPRGAALPPGRGAATRFPVKMLRWVQVSPDGRQGRLPGARPPVRARTCPNGTPRRLTKQTEHFEHYPAFSRDGASIVFTTWDDEELGTVRVVPGDGRRGPGADRPAGPLRRARALARRQARRLPRRRRRLPAHRPLRPGAGHVRRSRSTGGDAAPDRARTGSEPHFGAGPTRVFFLTVEQREKEDERALKSVRLDGARAAHATSRVTRPTEYRVSPDGSGWPSGENFNAFVMPLPRGAGRGGQPRDEGPAGGARCHATRASGSTGPATASGCTGRSGPSSSPASCTTLPLPRGRARSPSRRAGQGPADRLHGEDGHRPSGTVALVGGRVITMKGDEVLEDGTVVVQGNRIMAVGPRASVTVPAGARVVDVRGKTIMPGLVDVHWHGAMGDEGILPEQNWSYCASLAFGVTTVHDPSNDTETSSPPASCVRAGGMVGPAHLLHRHHPLRRRRRLPRPDRRRSTTRARTCGGSRPSGRSASRATTSRGATSASRCSQRRARAGHDGGARGRLARSTTT